MAASPFPFGPAVQAALWQLRRDFAGAQRWWVLALAGVTLVTAWHRGPEAAVGWLGLVLLWLGAALLHYLSRQNEPQTARLVPGQLRALRAASVGVVLGLGAAAGVVMGLGRGQPMGWAIGAALALLIYGAGLRWWSTWLIAVLIGATAFWWADSAAWDRLSATLRDWHADQPVALALVAAGLIGALASRLPAAGGIDRGRRQRRPDAPMARIVGAATANAAARPVPNTWERIGHGVGAIFAFLLPPWRAWLLRHAQPTPRSALARAELAMYGSSHWSGQLSAGVIVFALLAGLFAVLIELTPLAWAPLRDAAALGLSIGIASVCFNPVLSLPVAMGQTRREQALLMLLPGMPRDAALNRALARRQMQHVAVGAAVALLLPWALLGRAGLEAASLCVAVLLPLSVALWRNTARQAAPGAAHYLGLIGAAVLLVAVLRPLGRELAWSPWSVLGVGVALWAALMLWRWRALRHWPAMLPVGRHASAEPEPRR
jgi:hypothetical protein